jgi:hypothetical protein
MLRRFDTSDIGPTLSRSRVLKTDRYKSSLSLLFSETCKMFLQHFAIIFETRQFHAPIRFIIASLMVKFFSDSVIFGSFATMMARRLFL